MILNTLSVINRNNFSVSLLFLSNLFMILIHWNLFTCFPYYKFIKNVIDRQKRIIRVSATSLLKVAMKHHDI